MVLLQATVRRHQHQRSCCRRGPHHRKRHKREGDTLYLYSLTNLIVSLSPPARLDLIEDLQTLDERQLIFCDTDSLGAH